MFHSQTQMSSETVNEATHLLVKTGAALQRCFYEKRFL